MKDKLIRFAYRKQRVKEALQQANKGLPRLAVRRSLKYFYAQVIDDAKGRTLAFATSKPGKGAAAEGGKKSHKSVADAKTVGKAIAERALKAGVERVVFDRGGYLYHGRVKALAEAARQAGLKF
ncbi:MAG TPA: 50S ribosomal protein L18 [Elusimicrobia bacterium]|nr:50S ribosomal protein L18 [Elusimicrobiota bacterium]